MENEKNEKKDESVVNVGEVKGKVNNKKVEVKKIIGGKKMVKKMEDTWPYGHVESVNRFYPKQRIKCPVRDA